MNSQQLCVPQQQLCLSTNDKERAPWEVQRGEGQLYMVQEEWKPLGKAACCLPRVLKFV